MRKFLFYSILSLPLFAGATGYKHNFKTVPNDPYKVLHYELDNGLQVYLSVNKDEPRVSTNIAVRTGSKNDPPEVTGLAHYLEHMLFKGTSRIASLNWQEEKKLLDQISNLYETYRKTTDPDKRREIYAQIDSLSNKASEYVATNEYDQMISELGARGTNAYTSMERTVYINDVPTNELEKWMMIESERFQELTLRLFHTELEAVYEEFNRGQDSDNRQAYAEMFKALFPNHTYGTQTTIGKGEHLKNPSMVKIHEYFDKYYVPNNMAIVMIGDLDPDKTVDLIEKYFGSWEKGPEPEQFQDPGQPAITAPIKKEVTGSEAEFVNLAYRVGGIDSQDALMAELVSSILSNGEAGLIDQNLNNQQKLLRAYAYANSLKDYTILAMGATPRQDQSLEEASTLLLEQVDLLKKGDFDESLIASIVRNAKKSQMLQAENNAWKAYTVLDAFILDKPWEYFSTYYDRMAKISKTEVVEWANNNLGENYVAVYKRKGERNPLRLEKPAINPVAINRGQKSPFRTEWEKTPSTRVTPRFIDYKKDLVQTKIDQNLNLFYIPNTTNELFQVHYIFDMGSRNDKDLALAVQYLPYLGTDDYTVDEIKRRFYDLALDYNVYAGEDRVYVSLSGLNESLDEGMKLFEELLNSVVADQDSYDKFVQGIEKKRADAKLSKYQILNRALMNYAMYGPENPQTDQLSAEELAAIDPSSLAGKLHNLSNYRHKVFYYGPSQKDEVAALVKKNHRYSTDPQDYPERKEYAYSESNQNKVYFVDYDMVQTELMMLSKGDDFNAENLAPAYVFNQYFGAGLSSIVFQEIRESKALAYSAYSYYSSPGRADEPHFVRAYIGTQSDKLRDAVAAMTELMTTMPREEAQFEQAKLGALKQIETNPVTKSSIFWSYQNALDRGMAQNHRPAEYASIQKMSIEDMEDFFNRNISSRKYSFLVIGKKDQVDMEALASLGEVQELSLEEIFGY